MNGFLDSAIKNWGVYTSNISNFIIGGLYYDIANNTASDINVGTKLSKIRMSTIARYTANFTPPSIYSDFTGTTDDLMVLNMSSDATFLNSTGTPSVTFTNNNTVQFMSET